MNRRQLLLCLLIAAPAARARSQLLDLDNLVETAQGWAQENLDGSFVKALGQIDGDRLTEFFREIQKRLKSDWVLDLASLRDEARWLLPLLSAHEETLPYSVWLSTRLDYLDVAEEFRKAAPPPKIEPGRPVPRRVLPAPIQQRTIWRKAVSLRSAPVGAEAQLSRLKAIFRAEKAPTALVWLAEVESSFNPRARSPAGAVGLFQLMPATAKQYGLSLWPRDERYDAERSAMAGARHLRRLRNRFKDWPLAVAAYNAGEGHVQKLLSRSKATTFDQISRKLPAETQLYVPKVDATLFRREQVTLDSLV